jgi:large subunit ribosomal protein L9
MKVVFLEDLAGTAQVGEVKEVKNGFARNFLLPRGIALAATAPALQQAQSRAKADEKRQAALDGDAQKQLDRFSGVSVTIRARVGEQGRLYGSVTAADIGEEIEKLLGGEFDRRKIELAEPIRELGSYHVPVRMTRNVHGAIEVTVEGAE